MHVVQSAGHDGWLLSLHCHQSNSFYPWLLFFMQTSFSKTLHLGCVVALCNKQMFSASVPQALGSQDMKSPGKATVARAGRHRGAGFLRVCSTPIALLRQRRDS
ncbi:unnamed protein product [Ostreobium quekettii]|uniref:Uncharacterized protein n=1 Tax=Ostreobium quekettii TaxID=121088 RepID=A0A8S1J5D6_9CHLO|nr:unnamed protein product [Ostreobium quekettii]